MSGAVPQHVSDKAAAHGPKPRGTAGRPKKAAYWTPDRLAELCLVLAEHGMAEASRRFHRDITSLKQACSRYGITTRGVYEPPPEPKPQREVWCLGPDPKRHKFWSEDPRYERICQNCRNSGVFRAFR